MKKVSETISNYFKDQKGIAAVFLFGSYAVDKERHFSDIDIGIVVAHASESSVRENMDRYLLDLSRILRKDIHITMLNNASENLLLQVLKKGQCLVVNNKKEFSIFKMNGYAKIAGFNYHKKMMQQGFLNSMMEA